ncbi:MAG: DUF4390 domain-containing protein [Deltaproteobacteria bacterium]|nr:DUF4390 domain-containing protein [Deltaproteobacteria bacterium]
MVQLIASDRKSPPGSWIAFAILAVLIFVFGPDLSHAENATIDDVLITPAGEHLLLYCRARNCFTEEMNRAILSGIQTTFTFRVQFYKETRLWFDEELADLHIDHTIKYNSLKRQFVVTIGDGRSGNENITLREFYKAKALLTELNGIQLAPLTGLDPEATYRLRVKAELNKVRLPFYLHYVLFFVSLWDFETEWHEIELTYEGNPL